MKDEIALSKMEMQKVLLTVNLNWLKLNLMPKNTEGADINMTVHHTYPGRCC